MTTVTLPASRDDRLLLLVVEDDATIGRNLVEYLEGCGDGVDLAWDGAAAMSLLGRGNYDAVVLDLGLPRADGLAVLQHLRGRLGQATPVLVLTARDELSSKAACFAAGADDYLVKPFALAELRMRLQALHRRARGAVVPDTLRAGRLALDRRTQQASVDGVAVRLMPRSLRLLDLLLRDPGRVVPRAELQAALWPDDLPEGDPLRSQVHLLRRALAQAGYDGLETVHGIGYRLRDGDG